MRHSFIDHAALVQQQQAAFQIALLVLLTEDQLVTALLVFDLFLEPVEGGVDGRRVQFGLQAQD